MSFESQQEEGKGDVNRYKWKREDARRLTYLGRGYFFKEDRQDSENSDGGAGSTGFFSNTLDLENNPI